MAEPEPPEPGAARALVPVVVLIALGLLAAGLGWWVTRDTGDEALAGEAGGTTTGTAPAFSPCGLDEVPADRTGATAPRGSVDPLGRPVVRLSGRVLEGVCRTPVQSLVVWVYAEQGDDVVVGGGVTDGDGMFRVDLPTGRYRVAVQDVSADDPYTFVWYRDSPDKPGAEVIVLTDARQLEDVIVHRPADHPIPGYAGDGRRIAVIGDSLVQQSVTPIRNALAPHGSVSVVGIADQRIDEMEPVARRYAETDPDVVVVALGNNDAIQDRPVPESIAALERLIDLYDRDTCVVVLSVTAQSGDPAFNLRAAALDFAMVDAVARHPNARLVDWNAVVGNLLATNPDPRAWFTDGLHLQAAGMQWYATTMAGALASC